MNDLNHSMGNLAAALESKALKVLTNLIDDEDVTEVAINHHQSVWYFHRRDGRMRINEQIFQHADAYRDTIVELMQLTNNPIPSLESHPGPALEGSLRQGRSGSVHVFTEEGTSNEPVVTIRKQPLEIITLDNMLANGMMTEEMRLFLQMIVQGRANIVVSGAGAAGKTTMMRAFSQYVNPEERICTVEDIDELRIGTLPGRPSAAGGIGGRPGPLDNTVSLLTSKVYNDQGILVRETTLSDLVKESLRARVQRIWVGETRGAEADALVQAATTGHDGSITTVHAKTASYAMQQLRNYLHKAGHSVASAGEALAEAFDVVVQIRQIRPGHRVITEIQELQTVTGGDQGAKQLRQTIFGYDEQQGMFYRDQPPSRGLLAKFAEYGVDASRYGF